VILGKLAQITGQRYWRPRITDLIAATRTGEVIWVAHDDLPEFFEVTYPEHGTRIHWELRRCHDTVAASGLPLTPGICLTHDYGGQRRYGADGCLIYEQEASSVIAQLLAELYREVESRAGESGGKS